MSDQIAPPEPGPTAVVFCRRCDEPITLTGDLARDVIEGDVPRSLIEHPAGECPGDPSPPAPVEYVAEVSVRKGGDTGVTMARARTRAKALTFVEAIEELRGGLNESWRNVEGAAEFADADAEPNLDTHTLRLSFAGGEPTWAIECPFDPSDHDRACAAVHLVTGEPDEGCVVESLFFERGWDGLNVEAAPVVTVPFAYRFDRDNPRVIADLIGERVRAE